MEITSVSAQNASISQLLRQNDQRRIRQIHGQIRIFLHELHQTRVMIIGQLKELKCFLLVTANKIKLCINAAMLQQHIADLRHHRPCCDEWFTQAFHGNKRLVMKKIPIIRQSKPESCIADNHRLWLQSNSSL
jgi:hypothetical protein